MGKTVFMFPGQGAQYIGMAKDFYDAMPECREVFEEASEASGLDIAALCFEENDKINITEYTQICMLTAETAILRALQVKGYKADVTAGLSLGEYGALIDRLWSIEQKRCVCTGAQERYLYAGGSAGRWSNGSSFSIRYCADRGSL